LDKFKFLPMMREVWADQVDKMPGDPGFRKWFFFVETDTFVVWESVFAWLEHFDASKKMFMGSPVWPKHQAVFAHGGSGFVLSRAALQAMNIPDNTHDGSAEDINFGMDMDKYCCGDQILAEVLKRKGVTISGFWPMFNGETPRTVPFGREHWCEPVLTLHHLQGEELNDVAQWASEWRRGLETPEKPMLFEDLIGYIEPHIAAERLDWDNGAEDAVFYGPDHPQYNPRVSGLEKIAWKGADACKSACQANRSCLQFKFHKSVCSFGYGVRLGNKARPDEEGEDRFYSGWMVERIRDWKAGNKCSKPHWVRANP